MPDFIQKNWKAWAGSLAAMVAAAVVGAVHKFLPDMAANAELDQAIKVVIDGAVVGTLGYALTWIFPANKPNAGTMIGQAANSSSAAAEVVKAAEVIQRPGGSSIMQPVVDR